MQGKDKQHLATALCPGPEGELTVLPFTRQWNLRQPCTESLYDDDVNSLFW